MWSFLTRKTHRQAHRNSRAGRSPAHSDERAWSSGTKNSIARIDRIGPTAVATLTVTALSTQEGVALLGQLFHDVNHSGAESLVLDIQNLEYMDSACMGCLVKALNSAVAGGGRIAVVNSDGSVQDLFRITRLDRLFPICHDVPSALAALDRA